MTVPVILDVSLNNLLTILSYLAVYAVIANLISVLLLTLSYSFSTSLHNDSEALKEYECGFNVFDSATKLPFDVQFYIVGLVFLIFDLEVAVIFPWVLSFPEIDSISYFVMLIFIIILTVGFAYEWYTGVLGWPSLVMK